MKRLAENYLNEWKERQDRKPLIVRGARQTGKTYLIDQFSQRFTYFLKVDFEFDIDVIPIFKSRDPQRIINELSIFYNIEVKSNKTLIFLDEIQVCPEAIACLRYFYEKMPELHIIAAGSLLDFTLRDFSYSMPVGRIEFLYLNPMSFEEFLLAVNPKLFNYLQQWSVNEAINDSIHNKLVYYLREFFFVGGMPEAVNSYVINKDYINIQRIQSSIISTMQNDFSKYGNRKQTEYLKKVMLYVSRNIGKKIKYSNIDREVRSKELKEAIQLLSLSKVIHIAYMTKGNGIPLEVETVNNHYKTIFLDIGLVNNICGLKLIDSKDLISSHEGSLAEQFAGQELLNVDYFFENTRLYYWAREKKNANAEIDYLISYGGKVIPVEIKAGKTGTLKSLHLFLYEKKSNIALRFNIDKPSTGKFKNNVPLKKSQDNVEFTLLSLPLYLIGQLERILSEQL
ncbi:ATPase AAA [Candidatus Magnetomorum sp. HK-1]|nr:ATPase AAA [Candidatus Magnetomorum sp. HK-1]